MKNKIKLLCLSFLLSFVSLSYVQAHALYIDTEGSGKLNTKQDVKVYYSEFEDRTNEQISDWYSDVAKFELWLIAPNGKKSKLKTSAQSDHFVAAFTPKKEGVYRLEIHHTAKDPADGTAYQFNAFAQVLIGKSSPVPPVGPNAIGLALIEESVSLKKQPAKIFKTYLNGDIKGDVSVTVFLPSGKEQKVKSNGKGELKINFDEEGIYFIEATTYNKGEAGKTKTTAYQSIWRCATQKISM
ncbi:hypothetical protein AAG747_12815 [Rapidithrix thailandica]|uniref:DUF4198 domain-containing protein n=1 Tax=Rapidithrix thailandica TaxID=413964 RepID=A0AAW9SAM6_9BACT